MNYFSKTFELLSNKLIKSPNSELILNELEKNYLIKFPKAVFEWYSYDKAVEILKRYSNCDYPVDVDKLGKEIDNWYGSGNYDFKKDGLILLMTENQGVCNWAVKLDGSDDPPVLIEVDTAPNQIWNVHINKFSDFIYSRVWDYSTLWCLEAQVESLIEDDLDLLQGQFKEDIRTYFWPGKTNYRFFREDMKILIWDDEEVQADWLFYASSVEHLEHLIKAFDFSGAVYSLNEIGEKAIKNLKNSLK